MSFNFTGGLMIFLYQVFVVVLKALLLGILRESILYCVVKVYV